ncbi:GGDEF domain-containing protein [Halomonas chromatireducens]|uniref:diguanylate cyclase n=1 Tax=Halomonas chromatireducens TaxID=507626 RepID=A0A0X8HBL8_9GAMM|nr:GGDEF domain-containing protein [Halomonas chromatireducens]AMC99627.1 Phytochrome-like protein cph2 [Halomonas chromatireducens]
MPNRSGRCLLTVCVTLLLALGLLASPRPLLANEAPLTPVSLQLLWYHQFQYAGYYAAKAQGYFQEAGLDVEIRDGGYHTAGRAADPVREVVTGRADFGVSRSDLLLHRARGEPVMVVANIMQRSPLVFLTLERFGFSRLEEVGDRPISVTLPGVDERISAETLATFLAAGVNLESLNNAAPSWNLQDLYAGRTQLVPAYSTDGLYAVRRHGEVPVIIRPADYGIDFYGDLLFTRQALVEQHPERVAAFRKATIRGWVYAFENLEETVDLILEAYPRRHGDIDRDLLLHEAEQVRELMQPSLIEIGYSNPQRWKSIGDQYLAMGMIDGYELEGFLFQPAPPPLTTLLLTLWRWLLPFMSVVVVAAGLAGYLLFTNRRLKEEIQRRREAEAALQQLADRDGLTGAGNRRLFEQQLQQEFQRSRRSRHALSIILMDVDNFKRINDEYGHLVGDQVLKEIVQVTRSMLRIQDHLARYGGEEFVVVLPETGPEEACLVAKRILEVNRTHPVQTEAGVIRYTLSLGLSELRDSDRDPWQIIQRADASLYEAKHQGRDRLCIDAAPTLP